VLHSQTHSLYPTKRFVRSEARFSIAWAALVALETRQSVKSQEQAVPELHLELRLELIYLPRPTLCEIADNDNKDLKQGDCPLSACKNGTF
jgi:hypothetical protein